MSPSVPTSPSALKSALLEHGGGGQFPARHAKNASMSASVPTSPSQSKSGEHGDGGVPMVMLSTLVSSGPVRHSVWMYTPDRFPSTALMSASVASGPLMEVTCQSPGERAYERCSQVLTGGEVSPIHNDIAVLSMPTEAYVALSARRYSTSKEMDWPASSGRAPRLEA